VEVSCGTPVESGGHEHVVPAGESTPVAPDDPA
jgi:hypothetical protein